MGVEEKKKGRDGTAKREHRMGMAEKYECQEAERVEKMIEVRGEGRGCVEGRLKKERDSSGRGREFNERGRERD